MFRLAYRASSLATRAALIGILFAFAVTLIAAPYANAISSEQRRLFRQRVLYADYFDQAFCAISSTNSAEPGTNTNIDYAGNQILTDAQLEAVADNTPIYEAAAQKVDIPWQMLAVVHLRESGLKRVNPANGQGIYQFYNKQGGPYNPGPVNGEEFLRQTILAAEFLKDTAKGNAPANRDLTANATPDAVKDTFFGYNGRAKVYVTQAVSLGYSTNQGYEGSPYVMNKADAKRDPDVAKYGTWGQIKTDGGSISYPANNDYGAFVTYAALAGISSTRGCSNVNTGPVIDRIVAVARQELALWESGELKPGSGYLKYSDGHRANWCAYFASWVFNQAGYPIVDRTDGRVAAVQEIWDIGREGGKFVYHDAAGYTPQVGDLVIQKNKGVSHVNIVVAVQDTTSATRITVIGGNQGGTSGFETSKVTEYTYTGTQGGIITGYVSPNIQ